MALSKRNRLYQTVAEKIARSIAAGEYLPGQRLPAERDLAHAFEVSRPTIREAVIALEIDGLVEVRVGAGVFVLSATPNAEATRMDIGAFELTEARLLFEGEVAALAATHVTDAELQELKKLLSDMDRANEKADGSGEFFDRKFHIMLGAITRNSAMQQVVEQFWTIRNRSPQCVRIFEKARAKGHHPVVNEHLAIVEALEERDPVAARSAMRAHLNQVLQYLLDATELEAIEETKARLAEQRSRFGRTANA